MQWIGSGFEAINRWQFVNDLTWTKNKHTDQDWLRIPAAPVQLPWLGGEHWRIVQLQPATTSGYDAAGNSLAATGDPFASFLLGQVQTANYQIPAFTTWNGGYHAGYINDDFKATSKLTLTLGFRFDYQTPSRERFNRFSSFDPSGAESGGRQYPGSDIVCEFE